MLVQITLVNLPTRAFAPGFKISNAPQISVEGVLTDLERLEMP